MAAPKQEEPFGGLGVGQQRGHLPIELMGGAAGLFGDPLLASAADTLLDRALRAVDRTGLPPTTRA